MAMKLFKKLHLVNSLLIFNVILGTSRVLNCIRGCGSFTFFGDYNARSLTISHSCFPFPSQPNSLVLLNCSISRRGSVSPFMQNCIALDKWDASTFFRIQEDEKKPYTCLLIEYMQKVHKGFHLEQLNCSHYSWVNRSSSDGEGYKLGTRMSIDIPDHVENLCKECEKPDGNCGVGLKCLCFAKECTSTLISNMYKVYFALFD